MESPRCFSSLSNLAELNLQNVSSCRFCQDLTIGFVMGKSREGFTWEKSDGFFLKGQRVNTGALQALSLCSN